MIGAVEFEFRSYIVRTTVVDGEDFDHHGEYVVLKSGEELIFAGRAPFSYPNREMARVAARQSGSEFVDMMVGRAVDVEFGSDHRAVTFTLQHRSGTWPARISRQALLQLDPEYDDCSLRSFHANHELIVHAAMRRVAMNPDRHSVALTVADFTPSGRAD